MPLTPPVHPQQEEEGREPSLDQLLRRLELGNAGERRQAAQLLERHAGTAPALVRRLRDEPEPAVREALFNALVAIGDRDAGEGLVRLLRGGDPGLRNGAVEALQQLPARFREHRLSLLADPDPQIRQRAVEIMRDLRDPNVPEWLAALLEVEEDANVCLLAVDVLAEVGCRDCLPGLEALPRRLAGEERIRMAVESVKRRWGEQA
jgi:HEAT repeat protein